MPQVSAIDVMHLCNRAETSAQRARSLMSDLLEAQAIKARNPSAAQQLAVVSGSVSERDLPAIAGRINHAARKQPTIDDHIASLMGQIQGHCVNLINIGNMLAAMWSDPPADAAAEQPSGEPTPNGTGGTGG